MFNNSVFSIPSASVITYIPTTRYDERGRQLQFVESDVQRQQRLALLKGSRDSSFAFDSSCSSPSSASSRSLSSSPSGSPHTNFIDISSLPEPYPYTEQQSTRSTVPTQKRSHKRQSSNTLNVIPEED